MSAILKRVLDELGFGDVETREAERPAYSVDRRGTTTPIMLQHEFNNGYITWQRGDKFNYRVFMALLMIDKDSAKTYYFTTHS